MVASNTARDVALTSAISNAPCFDAVGQDMLDLVAQAFLVRPHRLAGLLGQRQIGREHLGIVGQTFLCLFANSVRSQRSSRAGAGPDASTIFSSGALKRSSQRLATAWRSEALLGKCR